MKNNKPSTTSNKNQVRGKETALDKANNYQFHTTTMTIFSGKSCTFSGNGYPDKYQGYKLWQMQT